MQTAFIDKRGHRLRCLLASTQAEREVGLSRHSAVPADGMLFDLGRPLWQAMTMHETAIPLGIVWISPTGHVVAAVPHARPFDRVPYAPPPQAERARWVLEVSPATFRRFQFRPGDRLQVWLPASLQG